MQSEEQRAIAESNVFVCVFRAVRVCLQLHSGYVLRSLLKKSGSPAASCTQCTHVQIIIALILCNSRTKPLSMKNIGQHYEGLARYGLDVSYIILLGSSSIRVCKQPSSQPVNNNRSDHPASLIRDRGNIPFIIDWYTITNTLTGPPEIYIYDIVYIAANVGWK